MLERLERVSPLRLLAGTILLCATPFVGVSLFKTQLYTVVDAAPYLVFHNVAELFSVMVSFSIFGLGWHAYDQNQDRHALFMSVAFLVIGLLDFMHTLGYPGMPPLVTPNSPNKSTQFWIVVRLFAASTFLASAFIRSDSAGRLLSKPPLMTAALVMSSLVFVGITFYPEYLPATFVQGIGLTPFKIVSEYVIIVLLILASIMYWRRYSRSEKWMINYYLAAFSICIFSELSFTLYASSYDTYNMLGHLYKIVAFGLIYRAIFVASIRKPYEELLVSNDELRLNRNMLSHVMNSIPQSIFWKDRESTFLGCNQVFASQAGVGTPEAIVGKTDFDLPWHPDESSGYRADDREVMSSGVAKHHILETQRQADGTVLWVDTTKIPLTDASGMVVGILGVYEDITKRIQAEKELKEALLFNQQIINCAQEGIIVYDRDLRYRVWNPFMERVSGIRSSDVLGKRFLDIFPSLKDAGAVERLNRVLEGETVETVEFQFQAPGIEKSSWTSDSSAPLLNVKGEVIGVIGTIRDTTETRRAEEQLRQSQKMEALGQLAGGVAHDFNNMLQVIMGYASLLQDQVTATQKVRVDEILAASLRAADLTSGLLSYSRKQVFKIEPTDLRKLVSDVGGLLRRILGEDISLSLELPHEPLIAAIDRTHVQQVFLNLATNARDAMPTGGRLSIRMERIEPEKELAHDQEFGGRSPYAHITISDTGSGVPKEHLQRIFEPFFTTKGLGKGTGLGLSIVYGIITQHNGFIQCRSEPGEGTTFHVHLPLCSNGLRSEEVVPEITKDDAKGVTILIAEDDPAVRQVTCSILQPRGYTLLEASNGKEAVELFRKHGDRIDLVILDAMMPEMNGGETLSVMRELKPGIRALFISGYAREIISGKMLIPDDAEFLNKPLLPARLIEAIKKTTRGMPDS